ncbi:MAG: methyltransferase [Candidatus Pacearchaeota archaeon]
MINQKKIQFFSKETNKFYQLYGDPPTLKISGVPMHRHIKMNPLQDTKTKINAVKPYGIVLDTCTGLGYTAIYAAQLKNVKKVITIEKDKNVIEIAKLNLYSKELFENKKIILINDDVTKKIKEFSKETFDTIIHDPPTFSLAPELYSKEFYKEIWEVLKKNGKLWHYCPSPGKTKNKNNFKPKIISNLKKIGFRRVFLDEISSGIICLK